MAKLICSLKGVRGRNMDLYDTKIVITTNKTIGSFLAGNITDGKKTIFMCDIVGVQLKKSGLLIGYLQFETSSMQMDNQKDNMFSENTFTYENGKNGITNDLIETVYNYVVDRIEEIKYKTPIIDKTPDLESMKNYQSSNEKSSEQESESSIPQIICPKCGTKHDFDHPKCPNCKHNYNI